MQSINFNRATGWSQRGSWLSALAAVLIMGTSSLAQAAPLNLTLNDFPDIVSSFITVNYDPTSDVFTANGFAQELDDDGSVPAEAILAGTFGLTTTIDAFGVLSGGTLTIGGTVASLGFNSGTLLTGDLTALGFNNAGDPLEFLFDVTGGDAFALYGGGSLSGGIILSNSGFEGNWENSFTADATAASDTGVVPVPAAVWLFGSGLIGLVGFGRHARRKQNS